VKLTSELELGGQIGAGEKVLREFREQQLEPHEISVDKKTGAVLLKESAVKKVLLHFGLKKNELPLPSVSSARVCHKPINPKIVYAVLFPDLLKVRVDVRRARRIRINVGDTLEVVHVQSDLWKFAKLIERTRRHG